MALKDSLKHFKDFDGYSGSLTKADMDNNLDLLADEIDIRIKFNPDTRSVAFSNSSVADGYNSLAFGVECEANGYSSFAFGNTCKATADYSEAWGATCEASGFLSYARGYYAKASANAAQVFGNMIENKQPVSIAYGGSYDGISNQNLRHFNILKTTGDTQTEFGTPLALWIKSLNYIIIKCEAIQDDFATKWIFERKLIVRVNENGEITIDSDNNTDIVKDDSDWAFDIEAVNDATNPTLKLKATGKADTNIAWGIEVENRQTYWN
jgi:hypothetical protein